MIFSKGNRRRTLLWMYCQAQGRLRCVWAASTCWCLCPSPAPCFNWPPGRASPCTGASCRASRAPGRARNMAAWWTLRPFDLDGAEMHTDTFILGCLWRLWHGGEKKQQETRSRCTPAFVRRDRRENTAQRLIRSLGYNLKSSFK